MEMPQGFRSELMKDLDLMNHFSSLTVENQQKVVKDAYKIDSKEQMFEYAKNITKIV